MNWEKFMKGMRVAWAFLMVLNLIPATIGIFSSDEKTKLHGRISGVAALACLALASKQDYRGL